VFRFPEGAIVSQLAALLTLKPTLLAAVTASDCAAGAAPPAVALKLSDAGLTVIGGGATVNDTGTVVATPFDTRVTVLA